MTYLNGLVVKTLILRAARCPVVMGKLLVAIDYILLSNLFRYHHSLYGNRGGGEHPLITWSFTNAIYKEKIATTFANPNWEKNLDYSSDPSAAPRNSP